jgi:hypothetical protein
MTKRKVKVSKVTQAMRTKTAAPITATVLATSAVQVVVWVGELAGIPTAPAFIQAALTGLLGSYIWFKFPVHWDA